jgi:hypothetical protein
LSGALFVLRLPSWRSLDSQRYRTQCDCPPLVWFDPCPFLSKQLCDRNAIDAAAVALAVGLSGFRGDETIRRSLISP